MNCFSKLNDTMSSESAQLELDISHFNVSLDMMDMVMNIINIAVDMMMMMMPVPTKVPTRLTLMTIRMMVKMTITQITNTTTYKD